MEAKKQRGSGEDDADMELEAPETERTNGSVNPLLVDVVLDKIFHLIISPIQETSSENPDITYPSEDKKILADVSRDVQSFRLVCKLWRDRATTIFKEFRSSILFGVTDKGKIPAASSLKLQRFLQTMRKSTMIPTKGYVIWSPLFKKRNQKLINDFLEVCGPEMVNLRMCTEYWNYAVNIKLGETGLLNLPKLKSFNATVGKIGTCRMNPQKCEDVGSLFGLILKSAPNLTDFRLEYTDKEGGEGEIQCEELFGFIPASLQRLQANIPDLSDVYLESLIEKNVRLEIFNLFSDYNYGTYTEEVVRQFFQLQSSTLKDLVWPTTSSSLLTERFPKMKELKALALDGIETVPISFPEAFPKLKILNLKSLYEKATVQLLSSTKPAFSVEVLHLPHYDVKVGLVEKLAKIFPAVKKLHMSGVGVSSWQTRNILPEVFTYFPDIEELFITFSAISEKMDGDSMLSGVSNEKCKQIRDNGKFDTVNLAEFQREPSILQLTKLKKLVLRSCFQVRFTDLSAQLIFMKMDSLEELDAGVGFKKLSLASLKKLKSKLKLTVGKDDDPPFLDFEHLGEDDDSDSDSEWETDSDENSDDNEDEDFDF